MGEVVVWAVGRPQGIAPTSGVHNHRHSGESRRFSGRNVHPEGPGNGDAHVN